MVDDRPTPAFLRRDSLDLHRHRLSTATENDQEAQPPSRQRCAIQDGTIQSRYVVRNFHNQIRAARHHQTLHQKLLPAANAAAREAVRRQTRAPTRDPQ
jgi:ribosome-binding protein aMBF1 (putative translation factor)